MLRRAVLALAVASCLVSISFAADWNQFRGPRGDGIAGTETFPTKWTQSDNKWSIKLPGENNGSPIFSGGVLFVTSASGDGSQRTLHAIDSRDGKVMWSNSVEFAKGEKTHKTNLYGGSTPAADGRSVVVSHGSAGVYCYDFRGKQLWKRELGAIDHMWGYGTSPVIRNGLVYLNHGPGNKETFMVALDLKTGTTKWKQPEPGRSGARMVGSWSTPLIANVNGEDQLICSMASRVVAYDLDDGNILWTVGGLPSPRGDLVYTSPSIHKDLAVALGGYKGPRIGFKLGGSGDVTESQRLWREEKQQPQRIGSGVVVDGYLYIGNAGPGTIECIEVKTGKTMWRTRGPGNHWASTVLAGGLLYATAQNAAVTVFKPNPKKFEQVAVNRLRGSTNSTPAFSDGRIYIRTFNELFCFGE